MKMAPQVVEVNIKKKKFSGLQCVMDPFSCHEVYWEYCEITPCPLSHTSYIYFWVLDAHPLHNVAINPAVDEM